jgi:hypothetical protein
MLEAPRGWSFAATNNQNDSEATLTETIVSVGTSSGSVLSADANRTFLLLINDSANIIYVSIAGNAAALNAGQRLNANGGSLLLDRYVPVSAINAIATGANSNLLVTAG